MNPREPAEPDPAVLSDPLGDEENGVASSPETTALAPVGERSLAPYDPFRRYMAEIGKYPPLDREEERELARLYRDTGDREALFRLITANLMLVAHIALSFRRAARNLVRLPTYAGWWIRAYMVKFLLDNVRLVRVGTTNARRKLLRNLRKEKMRLEEQGFDVGPKLLAEHFDVSEEDVRDVQAALDSRDVSIDAPIGADDDRSRDELLPDDRRPSVEEEVSRREIQEKIESALARFRETIQERDLALLDERILSEKPLTLQALGERFGTTREAVRQAEVRLMKRLKEFLKDELGDLGQVSIGPDA